MATGAASGAASGMALGVPGAIGGGITGGVLGLFGNKKKKAKRLSSLDKNQQKLNKDQYEALMGKGPLADLYNYDPEKANAVFDQITARPAYRSFKEKIVPELTGQFRKQGLQNSSYMGDALGRAGRDVQENLDALRTQQLYGQENTARTSKQNAIENFQNRQNFAYDTKAQGGGFDINSILSSISGMPATFDKFKTNQAAKAVPAGATYCLKCKWLIPQLISQNLQV